MEQIRSSINWYESKLEKNRAEIRRLNTEIRYLGERMVYIDESNRRKLNKLLNELEEKNSRLSNLESEIVQLNHQLKISFQTLNNLAIENYGLRTIILELNQELKSNEKIIQDLENQRTELISLAKKAENKYAIATQHISSLRKFIEERLSPNIRIRGTVHAGVVFDTDWNRIKALNIQQNSSTARVIYDSELIEDFSGSELLPAIQRLDDINFDSTRFSQLSLFGGNGESIHRHVNLEVDYFFFPYLGIGGEIGYGRYTNTSLLIESKEQGDIEEIICFRKGANHSINYGLHVSVDWGKLKENNSWTVLTYFGAGYPYKFKSGINLGSRITKSVSLGIDCRYYRWIDPNVFTSCQLQEITPNGGNSWNEQNRLYSGLSVTLEL